MCKGFEREIILHCAPALCGIKSSNLVSLSLNNLRDIKELKKILCPKYNIFVIKKTSKRILILIYNEDILYKTLFKDENYKYLLNNKYPNEKKISTYLNYLKHKINHNKNFPHEIGVFLGYDVFDVMEFENGNKNCLYNGVWRVYSNLDEKLKTFDMFKTCSETCLKLLDNGYKLAQIIN